MFPLILTMSLWIGFVAPTLAPAALLTPFGAAPNATESGTTLTEKLSWSASRRLTWEDFKGTPDDANTHHALTAANLAVDARCSSNKVVYDVKCVFLPQESWTRNKNSEKLLRHEQLHFDLTEVHARQLRKRLNSMQGNCTNLQSNLNIAVKSAFKEWREEQATFDKISRHGLDKQEEKLWEELISHRLMSLQEFQ
jgi:hypothetical protein